MESGAGSARSLYYSAAAATAVASIVHLMLAPGSFGFNVNNDIFFAVAGIAQAFWIIPMVRRWGRTWYLIGIGGTIVLISMWAITRMPGNPITGRGAPAGNPMSIVEEVSQAAFIGLAAAIMVYESKRHPRREKNNRQNTILVGIVIAIVLGGLLVPMATGTGRPPGPRPGGAAGNLVQVVPQQVRHTTAGTGQNCTLTPSLVEVEGTPQQIEGPYFVDEKLDRSDIRSDPSTGAVEQGVPLALIINVYDTDGGTCVPLRGAQVDIWQANANGLYSDIQQLGTSGEKFLRGYQMVDGNGTARFATIYPGWYEGRALHIHVKVRTFEGQNKAFEWTSQLYLDDAISDKVQTQQPYSGHGPRPLKNTDDGIFTGPSTDRTVQSNAGDLLMLKLAKDGGQGYIGTFNVGVKAGRAA
jgi:protocatechuate 3,4-dioxygenase beta subunit